MAAVPIIHDPKDDALRLSVREYPTDTFRCGSCRNRTGLNASHPTDGGLLVCGHCHDRGSRVLHAAFGTGAVEVLE